MIGEIIQCAICGKKFKQIKHEPSGLHCSPECLEEGWQRYQSKEFAKKLIDEYRIPKSFKEWKLPVKNNQPVLYPIAKATKSCLYIYGLSGSGKSGLAQIVMQDYLRQQESCAFDSASNLFNVTRKYEMFAGSRVLCIDDLHVHKWGEFATSLLHDCLTQREQRRLRTIVTCEWDIETFAEFLIQSTGGVCGHSTLARLDACGLRLDLHCVGDNLRRVNPGAAAGVR